jgi:hypothetical protein
MDKSFRGKEKKIFKNIPYRWTTVGSMDHLDAATLENSRLQNFSTRQRRSCSSGDFNTAQLKNGSKYFLSKRAAIETKLS